MRCKLLRFQLSSYSVPTELRLALCDGLSLEISKLSLNKSSKDEEQEDRMEKSSREIGSPED